MYQLRKIKELNGYRFFQRFKWDESNCKLFAENNIIYGWNGSGKTTLCDFLKALVDQTELSEEIRFLLLFEDTDSHEFKLINKNQLETIPYRICVFHHNYIRDNISAVDHVKHIFSVGKEQTDRIIEVKELKEEVRKQSSRLKSLQNDLSAKKGEFEKFKAEKAKLIKDTVSYNSSYSSLISAYIEHIQDSFLISCAKRYDIKGKTYFKFPNKYYYADMGLRNARLNYRQFDPGHIMENMIYNDLIRRGYSVDVGVVTDRTKGQNIQKEIDFVVNSADKKIYIQSALQMDTEAKSNAELDSLLLTKDFFKKIIIRRDIPHSYYDDSGIMHCNLTDFLLGKAELF